MEGVTDILGLGLSDLAVIAGRIVLLNASCGSNCLALLSMCVSAVLVHLTVLVNRVRSSRNDQLSR